MRESDLYAREIRELDIAKAADKKVIQQIEKEAPKLGFHGIEVTYDSLAGGNSVHLYHTIANVANLAALCSFITTILRGASPVITIEDSELKVEF